MAVFRFRTIPALFSVALAGELNAIGLRHKLTRLFPLDLAMLRLLFILKGLSQVILSLSPDKNLLTCHHHSMRWRGLYPPPRRIPLQLMQIKLKDQVDNQGVGGTGAVFSGFMSQHQFE